MPEIVSEWVDGPYVFMVLKPSPDLRIIEYNVGRAFNPAYVPTQEEISDFKKSARVTWTRRIIEMEDTEEVQRVMENLEDYRHLFLNDYQNFLYLRKVKPTGDGDCLENS